MSMPEPRFVTTNGIRMAVYEAGSGEKSPPVVLCHGFPEIAYSWRRQLPALAAAGYRVLAPDQRGYGLTDRPAPVDAYADTELCADLTGLLDAEGIARAVFVGHDWGGLVVWRLAQRAPDRVAGIIALNTPFIPRYPAPPTEIFKASWGADNYISFFQTPEEPERVLEADIDRTIAFFMRRGRMESAGPPGAGSYALQAQVPLFRPEHDPAPLLSAQERATYVSAFARSGFRGPVNWYRNFDRNWADAAGLPDRVEAPALMIMAALDPVLPPSMAEGMERYVPNLEKKLIQCGHWTQQEAPEEVNATMLDWLARRFP